MHQENPLYDRSGLKIFKIWGYMIRPNRVCSDIHGFVTNLWTTDGEVGFEKVDLELSVPHKKLDSTSY